jgi:hypothetical protein
VVLGLGGAGEDHGVDDAVVGLLDVRLALRVDALDGRARAVVGLLAERGESLLGLPRAVPPKRRRWGFGPRLFG